MRTNVLSILVIPAAALALAACGSSSSTQSSGAASAPAASTGGSTATVAWRQTSLGPVLVDSAGRTLYLYRADKGTTSACSGACAQVWPPLAAHGTPTAAPGVKASLLGTTRRSDGTAQVTYAGHPLYSYTADSGPGSVTGQGVTSFGAAWYALNPSGQAVRTTPAASVSSSAAPAGGGYGY